MAIVNLSIVLTFLLNFLSFHGARCGLYNKNDPMELLDNSTIKRSIYNSEYVWVVEFYSSWCGHCHAFAPTWKKFAREVTVWDEIVQVGAIDCAEDKNLDTCRNYAIDSFPTVKFFEAQLKNKSNVGTAFKGQKTVKSLRHSLVEFIEDHGNKTNVPKFTPTE
eukprot:gene15846-17444_t